MDNKYTFLFNQHLKFNLGLSSKQNLLNNYNFLQKIIKYKIDNLSDINIDNILFGEIWDIVELFQINHKLQKNTKYSFIILTYALFKKFPTLEVLSLAEMTNLILLGKDIALTASEIPDTILFVKNIIKAQKNYNILYTI